MRRKGAEKLFRAVSLAVKIEKKLVREVTCLDLPHLQGSQVVSQSNYQHQYIATNLSHSDKGKMRSMLSSVSYLIKATKEIGYVFLVSDLTWPVKELGRNAVPGGFSLLVKCSWSLGD